MKDLEPELLLTPLSAELPCGMDTEYEPTFLELEIKAAGKPERQFGPTVIPAQNPEWGAVHDLAITLAQQTRDLRLAIWLIRSGARLQGLDGAASGLTVLRGLIERYWDTVHPLLDATDDNDPTARLSAFAMLLDRQGGMADLRAATLGPKRDCMSLRDIELAWGADEPLAGESAGTRDGVATVVGKLFKATPDLAVKMKAMHDDICAIDASLREQLGAAVAPDMRPLKKLLNCVAEAAVRGNRYLENLADNIIGSTLVAAGSRSAALSSRADVASVIEKLCEWLDANEPSHPAPLLLRRASRLMSMSFVDIVHDLVPDGISRLESLAGVRLPKP